VPNVYAAVPGFQLLQEIGMANVASHIKRLAQSLLSCALDLGIRAKTPADSLGPLVVLQSKDSNLLVRKLAESDIVASNRHDGLRIAFHVYNTMDDVKAVAEVLKKNINLLVLETARVSSYD
jgi:cysteine desulfurase / selenocysteine lyase